MSPPYNPREHGYVVNGLRLIARHWIFTLVALSLAVLFAVYLPVGLRLNPQLTTACLLVLALAFWAIGYGFYRSIRPKRNLMQRLVPTVNPIKTTKQVGMEFEEDIARMFRLYGYNVQMTPDSGDHGIDLRISKPPEYAVVQCKFYREKIGEPMIRDFYGAMVSDCAKVGYFITTSGFTDQAYEWAKGKGIILVDGQSLRKMQRESKMAANQRL